MQTNHGDVERATHGRAADVRRAQALLGYEAPPERHFARAKAQTASVHAAALQRSINRSAAANNPISRAQLRRAREHEWACQVIAREADILAGVPERQCTAVTAKSPEQLDAEYRRNDRVARELRHMPEPIRRRFHGMTFSSIRRDPAYLAAARTPNLHSRAPRQSTQTSTPGRRRLLARETSSADPGDQDGDPEPARRPRRSIYHPLAAPERILLGWMAAGARILEREERAA